MFSTQCALNQQTFTANKTPTFSCYLFLLSLQVAHQQQHSKKGNTKEIGRSQTCNGMDPLITVISFFVHECAPNKERMLLSMVTNGDDNPSPATKITWSCCYKSSSDADKSQKVADIIREAMHEMCSMYCDKEMKMMIERNTFQYVHVEVYRFKRKFWFELDRLIGGWCSDPREEPHSDEELVEFEKKSL